MMKNIPTQKTYVKVTTSFDATGYMEPKEIIWKDGRVFPIDRVSDFCPASNIESRHHGDCYTVLVQGQKKFLFFERADPRHAARFGRWYVEALPGS